MNGLGEGSWEDGAWEVGAWEDGAWEDGAWEGEGDALHRGVLPTAGGGMVLQLQAVGRTRGTAL